VRILRESRRTGSAHDLGAKPGEVPKSVPYGTMIDRANGSDGSASTLHAIRSMPGDLCERKRARRKIKFLVKIVSRKNVNPAGAHIVAVFAPGSEWITLLQLPAASVVIGWGFFLVVSIWGEKPNGGGEGGGKGGIAKLSFCLLARDSRGPATFVRLMKKKKKKTGNKCCLARSRNEGGRDRFCTILRWGGPPSNFKFASRDTARHCVFRFNRYRWKFFPANVKRKLDALHRRRKAKKTRAKPLL